MLWIHVTFPAVKVVFGGKGLLLVWPLPYLYCVFLMSPPPKKKSNFLLLIPLLAHLQLFIAESGSYPHPLSLGSIIYILENILVGGKKLEKCKTSKMPGEKRDSRKKKGRINLK